MNLTDRDKRLIYFIQGDLPVVPRPFARLAEKVGLTEDQVIGRLKAFEKAGLIRRFGATLFHQRTGYPANVMVAWQVPPERIEEVGQKLSSFKAVSHCYQRRTAPDWPFNLYTMVHGLSEADCRQTAARMARQVPGLPHQLLFSREELKKTSMRYFE